MNKFRTISSHSAPDVEQMRKRMKEQSASSHVDHLMDKPRQAESKEKVSRKTVKKYTAHFSTYLTAEQAEGLKKWCNEKGVSPAMALRMAIIEMLGKE